MADQILSQEEIDALLGAMAKGEVDLDNKPDPQAADEVKPYDLTSQGIMLRDEFGALEEIYDKFSGQCQKAISSFLQRSMEVSFVSSEMVRFNDFMKAFANPTFYNIFSMDPLIGSACLAAEANFVFSLIDCMFGGDGKPLLQTRDFTMIEQRMMEKFTGIILKEFEQAWKAIHSIQISGKKIETKKEFVHIVGPNEMVIVAVFGMNAQSFSGNIYICYSYLMLEPIRSKMSVRYIREKDVAYTWKPQLQHLMQDIEVTISAELGTTVQTVRDLLTLQQGDILRLNKGPEDLVLLRVEQVPKYAGVAGMFKGNRAIEINDLINRQGDRVAS